MGDGEPVESHEEVVDHHRDAVAGQQEHDHDLEGGGNNLNPKVIHIFFSGKSLFFSPGIYRGLPGGPGRSPLLLGLEI